MQTTKTGLEPPTKNDAIYAETLGKIHKIMLKPAVSVTVAQTVLDRAILDQLMLQLLSAPAEMLTSC